MSRTGRIAAKLFGQKLPAFADPVDAQGVLYRRRDELLGRLRDVAGQSGAFRPDFSPESLKDLERWYFELVEGGGFRSIGADEDSLERTIAMYLGAVLVRNAPPFEWFVTEFAFGRGPYEIGVRKPLYEVMLSRLAPDPRDRNKRGESLWRMYQRHARS
jgi:hypothetical protein